MRPDVSWQAQAGAGYDITGFQIDWEQHAATCPQGQTTHYWKPHQDAWGNDVIQIRFSRTVCGQCPARHLCSKAKGEPRSLTLRPQAEHEALQLNRQQQLAEDWKTLYAQRTGAEGTLSQGIRAFGLRHTRYIGHAKTHLQHLLTAAAMNLVRVDQWLLGTPFAQTRKSRFEALRPVAA